MSALRLHILMPCARPQNIPRLAPAYLQHMEPHGFELRWHILMQGPEEDPKGIRKINEAIGDIREGWIMAPADDTDQHPALFRRLHETVIANPHAGAIVFNQDRHLGRNILLARPSTMHPCGVCGGQIAWNREFLGDHRFDYEHNGGVSDGTFIQHMHRIAPDRFVFVDEILTRFGSLEW